MRSLFKVLLCASILAHTPAAVWAQEATKAATNSTPGFTAGIIDASQTKKITSLQTSLLPQVLQTAIQNGILSSSGSGITLQSSIYGILKLFDTTVKLDYRYKKLWLARNFALGAGAGLNNDNSISGFHTNAKWAIVNKRDETDILVSAASRKRVALLSQIEDVEGPLMAGFATAVDNAYRQDKSITLTEYNVITDSMIAAYPPNQSINMARLKSALLPYIMAGKIHADTAAFSQISLLEAQRQSAYKKLTQTIQRGSLLTFTFNSNYTSNRWDSLNFQLEYMHGLGGDSTQKDKPWDFYAGAFFNIKEDTLTKQALQRQVAKGKIGVNWVPFTHKDGSYLLEVLGTAEYDWVKQGWYQGENRSTWYADFTVTFYLNKTVYLPIEIKYDPLHGNFLGFLNVKWDILSKAQSSSK